MSRTPSFNPKLYWFSYWLIRSTYRTLLRGNIIGLQNVPKEGACIIASNHASHLDPPFLGCNLPRVVTYFARKTLWKPGAAQKWLDGVGAIPVDRDGESDVTALKRTLGALKNAGLLTLFPEGTRSPDGALQSPKPGIGLIAAKSQATVIPCRLFNTHKAFPKGAPFPNARHKIHIVYGRPLAPNDYDPGRAAGKERYLQIAQNIMDRIAAIPYPRIKVI